jgi:dihydropteroate synthase
MKKTIKISGKLLCLEKPLIMGIINLTPDSFHKDSRFNPSDEDFLEKAYRMHENGAQILDLGGYSSRPGADIVSKQEEADRVLEAIELLTKNLPDVFISIDTFRKYVAEKAILKGAGLVNDISGGTLDSEMHPWIIENNIPYILMHMRGNPKDMQNKSEYNDFPNDVFTEILEKANYLKKQGITDLILDLGFGFAKTLEQNYQLLKVLELTKLLDYPILTGISRKSMIYKALDISAAESLPATTQLHLFSLLKNTQILRVHDALEASQTVKLLSYLKNDTHKP